MPNTRRTCAHAALFLATLTVASTAQAQYNATVMATPGLLGYYTYTQAAQANSVVNGYTGVLKNGATVTPGGPPTGEPSSSALVLNNGTSGTKYAIAGGANPLQGQIGSTGSMLAWINLAALPSTDGHIFSIAGESAFADDFDLGVNTDNRITFHTDNGGFVGSDPLTASDLNKWIFVAATFTAGVDRNLYINGSLVASNTPGNHYLNTAPFYQGYSEVFGGRPFDGLISDVAIYNTDLTAAQVQAIYASRLGSPASPTTTPEPTSLALLGTGLVGLAPMLRRRSVSRS